MCTDHRNINDVRNADTASSARVGSAGVGAALALAGAVFAMPVAASDGDCSVRLFGLTADTEQRLVRFKECSPRDRRVIGEIWGLAMTDTKLIGIDFRVQDGLLYGVGDGGGVYTINTSTAEATLSPASPIDVPFVGMFFGVDFNPAANALRIISDTGQNLRHPFAGATQFVTQVDGVLSFPPAAPPALGVTGAAYTNNDLAADTGTTLFDIDTTGNRVAVQSPANSGQLVATGDLTIDVEPWAGFDIYSKLNDLGVTRSNRAFAALSVAGESAFYRVDLLTGKATRVAKFREPVVDIAARLTE